ncbi:MAG: TraR/DksA C4-type zinc finger protein [bacterium]
MAKTGISKTRLEELKKLLEKKRDKLLKELDYLEGSSMKATMTESSGDLTSYSYHMADQGTDAMEREKAFLFASREGRFLYHLNKALERIEEGTYGYCEECGKPIPVERLKAVPHARLCIECKTADDQRKAEEQ